MGSFHEDLLCKVTNYAARSFREQLRGSSETLDRLKKQGVTDSVIEEFMVGYATPDWRSLTETLSGDREYLLDCARTVGLVTRGRRGFHDRFRDRYVFPLRSEEGTVVGFTTLLAHALEDSFHAKPHDLVRMNSSHSPIFDKRNYLLGGTPVLNREEPLETLLVARDPLDTLRLHSRGHDNVISTLIPGAFASAEDGSLTRLLQRRADRVLSVESSDPEATVTPPE